MIEHQSTETRVGRGDFLPVVLILLAAIVVALAIWQPWSTGTSRDTSTTNQSSTTQSQSSQSTQTGP